MPFIENTVWVFWNVNGGEEVVVFEGGIAESDRYGVNGGFFWFG